MPRIPGNPRHASKRVELRLPADLADELEALMPRTQSLPSFCALLIEQELTRVRTLPAYCVGSGNQGHLPTETPEFSECPQEGSRELSEEDLPSGGPHLLENIQKENTNLEDGVGKGLSGETPRKEPLTPCGGYKSPETELVPAARIGKPRQANTKGTPEFEAFWRQYQAIKRRASSQSKPKALEVWNTIVPGISPEALSKALGQAVTQQVRQEREGGFASPFPDCFRWLRDGYYENHLDTAADPAAPLEGLTGWEPNTADPSLPF